MQTNAQGQVALKYYQPTDVIARDAPSGKEYSFKSIVSISLAWVDFEDVEHLLARTKNCCGAGTRPRTIFLYANDDDVRRWTNKGGR